MLRNYLWRQRTKFEATLAFSMLEPWEKILSSKYSSSINTISSTRRCFPFRVNQYRKRSLTESLQWLFSCFSRFFSSLGYTSICRSIFQSCVSVRSTTCGVRMVMTGCCGISLTMQHWRNYDAHGDALLWVLLGSVGLSMLNSRQHSYNDSTYLIPPDVYSPHILPCLTTFVHKWEITW